MFCRKWNFGDGKKSRWSFIGRIIGSIIGVIVFTALFGLVVQYLWNWLMPSLFNLAPITYYQAFGLMILARLLIGGFGHRGHHHRHGLRRHSYDKSCKSDDVDNWEYYDEWWKTEGKDAFMKYTDRKK